MFVEQPLALPGSAKKWQLHLALVAAVAMAVAVLTIMVEFGSVVSAFGQKKGQ